MKIQFNAKAAVFAFTFLSGMSVGSLTYWQHNQQWDWFIWIVILAIFQGLVAYLNYKAWGPIGSIEVDMQKVDQVLKEYETKPKKKQTHYSSGFQPLVSKGKVIKPPRKP
jgi:hypothetical protein